MNEATAILVLCAWLKGEPEVPYQFDIDEGTYRVRADCITDQYAIEIGLDKRSSLDSLQQAQFAAFMADKEPMVLLVDTDGVEGRFEYRIKQVARGFGVQYQSVPVALIQRLQMTEYLRSRRVD